MIKKISIVVVLLVLGFGYYTISPIFNNIVINEPEPIEIVDSSNQISDTSSTENINEEGLSTSSIKNESQITKETSNTDKLTENQASSTANSMSSPIVGTPGHKSSGNVKIINTPEGKVIRYENYKTINGPDLYVYLSDNLEATNFINLGPIKGTEGNINYLIPNNIDITKYKYVLTWCKQFGVLFNYAKIN